MMGLYHLWLFLEKTKEDYNIFSDNIKEQFYHVSLVLF